MQELTAKQKEAYDYIKRFMGSNGYAPTMLEIAGYLTVSPTVARTVYVEVLEKKGYVQRTPGKARTMRLLK